MSITLWLAYSSNPLGAEVPTTFQHRRWNMHTIQPSIINTSEVTDWGADSLVELPIILVAYATHTIASPRSNHSLTSWPGNTIRVQPTGNRDG